MCFYPNIYWVTNQYSLAPGKEIKRKVKQGGGMRKIVYALCRPICGMIRFENEFIICFRSKLRLTFVQLYAEV